MISITDRERLLALKPTPSQVVPAGKIMWLRGRKIIGYGRIDQLAVIPRDADGAVLSVADHAQLMGRCA